MELLLIFLYAIWAIADDYEAPYPEATGRPPLSWLGEPERAPLPARYRAPLPLVVQQDPSLYEMLHEYMLENEALR